MKNGNNDVIFRSLKLWAAAFILLLACAAASACAGPLPDKPEVWTMQMRRVEAGTPDGVRPVSITYYKNTAGIEFVWIPPGEFKRGSRLAPEEVAQRYGGDAADHFALAGADRYRNEHPLHRVELTEGFWLSRTPVTQEQWERVTGEPWSSYFDGARHPVEAVSWHDAMEFCEKLGELDGMRYRLPTEAEWEYAARAGSESPFYFGHDADKLGDFAWYGWYPNADRSEGNSDGTTHPVGTKKPNAWGLYDMHGNIFSWCLDWYGEYPHEKVTDPSGPPDGEYRVLRGGSWQTTAWYCRSALRNRNSPDVRSFNYGMRIVAKK